MPDSPTAREPGGKAPRKKLADKAARKTTKAPHKGDKAAIKIHGDQKPTESLHALESVVEALLLDDGSGCPWTSPR